MIKRFSILVAICIISVLGITRHTNSQTVEDNYTEKIKVYNKDNLLIERSYRFRDYVKGDRNRRLVVHAQYNSKKLDQLVWSSRHIKERIRFIGKLSNFAFIKYQKGDNNSIVARLYVCDNRSKEAVEMLRLQIKNYKIVGINRLPKLFNGFMPPR